MEPGIKTEILTGIFWKRDGKSLFVSPEEDGRDPVEVSVVLEPFLDSKIQIALHHWPSAPQLGLWGGGCCLWQSHGKCPAGHHDNPAFLLNVGGKGFLRRAGDSWWVELEGGTVEPLPLELMDGHRGRLTVVTLVDMEEFHKGFSSEDALTQTAILGSQLQDIKALLDRFKVSLKEG
jgi:hypothetical protein